MSGRFITLEGSEGVGKSTQVALLAEALRAAGKTVDVTREPGGTSGAEAIRALILTGEEDRWNAATEALLFAAARADHIAKRIRPAVAAGAWVVCDRYIDSTRAYQGGAGGMSDDDVMTLHRIGSGAFLPDRTVLLDLPVDAGLSRSRARDGGESDRMGSKDDAYYDAVATRFRAIAHGEPARFRIVDASGTINAVHARVMDALKDML